MNVKILLFGVAREIAGNSSLELDLPDEQNVGQMMEDLTSKYPAFKELSSLMVAVNSEYAEKDQVLNENDEIALIPPVSGG